MLDSRRQNIHHSKLPPPGAVGYLRGLSNASSRRKCIVSHYPVTDSSDYRFSLGIHTVWVRFLDNSEVRRVSGFWFEEDHS
jgi:hypothetical protein